MKYRFFAVTLALLASVHAYADTTPHNLAGGSFSQNWTNAALITANDNWSSVPSVTGFLGQDITTATGTDPQNLTGVSAAAVDLDVNANQTNPSTFTTGGVTEFEITNPTVALAGSGTADAPYLLITLNTSGRQNVNVAYNLRDIDGSTDNSIQPVALQYRVGNTGNFTNLPAGFVADASTGPSLATLVTAVAVTLPAAANNLPEVQLRVITTNAAGNDEYIGVDDIVISSAALAVNAAPTLTAQGGVARTQGSAASVGQIASVTDDGDIGLVTVTVNGGASATVTGITVASIVNSAGTVNASVVASCGAQDASFTLTASDGSLTTNSNLNVAATANTPPSQGTYGDASLIAGNATTVSPSMAPSDNGSIATITAAAAGFTGGLSVDLATGVVTVTNAGPASVTPYAVTVTATDDCGGASTATFQLTVTAANAAPTITSAMGLSRQQGSPLANSTVASVTDDADSGLIAVTVNGGVAATVDGITLSNISNAKGTITGDLIASCEATSALFTLTATDTGKLTATSTLNVAAAANTPPAQGTYSNTTLTTGGGTAVNPSSALGDNGSISSVTVAVSPLSFTGTVNVNPATGALTIANAGPAAVYTVTVTATDNCSATSTRTFQLTVNAANAAPTITPTTGLSRQQGSPISNSIIATVTDDGGNGSVTVTGAGTVNGITLSNIVNTAGTISGDLAASCTATDAMFTLIASDGSLTTNGTLTVTAPANTAPSQGTYGNTTLTAGLGTTVTPTFAPADNGSISSLTVGAPSFTGTLSVNSTTGVVTVANAGPAAVYTVTVTATDNCSATSTRTFQLTVNAANAAPTITPTTGLSRQQGSPISNSAIATVTDDGGNGSVTVTGAGTVNGITLSNIANTAGTISGDLVASCTATDAMFTLIASDGSLTTNGALTVTAPANTAPSQGTYTNTTLTAGGGTTVTPTAAPADNGSISSLTVAAPGFTGTLSVNPASGVVTITNAGPAAVYTVTVTATDNCGATSTRTFQLTVNPPSGGDPTITPVAASRATGSPMYRSVIANVSDAAGAGSVLVTVNGGASATVNGVLLQAIQNNNGVISAAIRGGCNSPVSPPAVSFMLTASSGSGTNNTSLPITITAGSNPTWCQWWPR